MGGADRGRFLGGLVTHDVKSLEPGGGAYGFVTSIKGRVLADVPTLALEDELWLLFPPGRGEAMARHLGKYKIVDRVELEAVESRSLALIGPGAKDVLTTLGVDDLPAEIWGHRPLTIAGVELRLVREPDLGVPAWKLWVVAGDTEGDAAGLDAGLATVREALLAEGSTVQEVPPGAVDVLRILAGRSRYGVDYGIDAAEDAFPQETGLGDEAVSYTKGCYLGQEVVARIHYRGGVNRHLRGLVLGGADLASPKGGIISVDGREAGRLGSVAMADGRSIGLAILHKRVEPGATVALESEGGTSTTAEVVELPF